MSLKDRTAKYENKNFREVVTEQEFLGLSGGPQTQTIEEIKGYVPVEGHGYPGWIEYPWPTFADPEAPSSCSAITKKGEPCKASPIKGEGLCVGHKRASDASGN